MLLKCDICGIGLKMETIGFVRHPHPADGLEAIIRCKQCHNSTKEKSRGKNSSYMILE
ncbi:MAG: hypothetical protein HYS81_03460 [Candidatus Aenigmatarchaeota archaeon]|nr:MAG: hypothetical protein HYS81_03460 [Candidatus Aenigmarchaeota archaeon]